MLNWSGIRLYRQNRPTLTEVQKRIVKDLQKDGIAQVHITELFPEDTFSELKSYMEILRKNSNRKKEGSKPYLTYLFDMTPLLLQ